jgi:hypothetical protein
VQTKDRESKVFKLRAVEATFVPGVRKTLKLQLPAALGLGLEHGLRESAAIKLTVEGRTAAVVHIASLRL